jgi:hypothetical protein
MIRHYEYVVSSAALEVGDRPLRARRQRIREMGVKSNPTEALEGPSPVMDAPGPVTTIRGSSYRATRVPPSMRSLTIRYRCEPRTWVARSSMAGLLASSRTREARGQESSSALRLARSVSRLALTLAAAARRAATFGDG